MSHKIKTRAYAARNVGKQDMCVVYMSYLYSSIAQSVERMTVNHDVTGSSPVGGAIFG